ncbi:MAG: hypothetical protein IKO07_14125 [Clostridia bacterium]|nr:hypothetical protein [Clostridia bacterium]
MGNCSFCKSRFPVLRAGGLALCAACVQALCGASPAERRYAWFERAVKRGLFPADD